MTYKLSKNVFLLVILFCVVLLLFIVFRTPNFENNTVVEIEDKENLPWYFKGGKIRPKGGNYSIWPDQLGTDRIHEQLMTTSAADPSIIKTIFLNRREFDVPLGDSLFKSCPVSRCSITKSRHKADAILFKDKVDISREKVSQKQIWILYVLESPVYSGYDSHIPSINWTATYREDSEIVTPYEKWMYFDENIRENKLDYHNYAAGKTKKVAWFVSNCLASNNRLEYAKELQKYIDVDIYGNCGDLTCYRSQESCFEMLREKYKFYLSFENCNCRDYITEKFFVNALRYDVVPVVMGAHPDDYKRVAPKYSFIHVDDFPSARSLADYLNDLNANDDLYNAYFAWKGTGEFINTRFFCRLCALLHNPTSNTPRYYSNFRKWWAGASICRKDSWLQ